jgi:hypothetical protein
MTIGLTEQYRTKLCTLIDSTLSDAITTFNGIESLIGKLRFASKPYELGRSYMHNMQATKTSQHHRALATGQ